MSSHELSAAYLLRALELHGITADAAIEHILANKGSFKCPRLSRVYRELFARMRRDGTGVSQTRHVKTALVDFWRYLPREQRERPGSISREQILEFLRPYESLSAKSYNERRGYLCTVFAVAVEFGWLTRSPVDSVPRRRSPRHRPPPSVLQPLAALRLLRWVQSNAPEWVPYFAFRIFAGLRPCVREGEAHRLDEDMRNPVALGGLPALDQDGF